MVYNKTEKRVCFYVEHLKKHCYRDSGIDVLFTVQQFKENTKNAVDDAKVIEKYPYAFGREGEDTWFEAILSVPEDEDVFLSFDLGTDGQMYVDGRPAFNVNFYHPIASLSPWKGKTIRLSAECWDGFHFPGWQPIDDHRILTSISKLLRDYPIYLQKPRMLYRNKWQYELWYDLSMLVENLQCLGEEDMFRQRGFAMLHEALMKVSLMEEDNQIREESAKEADKVVKELLGAKNGTFSPSIAVVGMSHLDHAWLWPKSETFRKSNRTISGMLHLMEEYPEFKYLCTQPVQMEKTFADYPELYEKAKKAFERGQWDPNGVCLVESDNILSSGEGLIRAFLYGRQTTEKLFPGYRGDTYIVPDSFGYNGNLPQIMAGCGVKYFVTSKLGWNDTNRFPYETFRWKGIDGTEVKSHMIQLSYNGEIKPKEIKKSWDYVQQKDVQSELLMTIGEGDGAGGTSRDDIENARRLKDLQGTPKVAWKTISEALESVFSTARDIPVYEGEQYFELHRGTYTSQAKMKKGYRRTNALLHNAEYLLASSWAERTLSDERKECLNKEIKHIWRETVINQFHDILPGSCVGCVYDEVNAFYYEDAIPTLEAIIQELATVGTKRLNLTPYTISGIAPYSTETKKSQPAKVEWGSVTFGTDGSVTSFIYKGRELVESPWNTLMIGEDVPLNWDAWDLEKDSLEETKPVSTGFEGMTRTGKLGKKSFISQTVVIHEDEARIDFVTDIDWQEDHQILNAVFPTRMKCENAIFDIPFGYVSRSTKNNTSIERAQFTSPAQKFVLLEDREVSVALMSDSKYGYMAKEGSIGITLLKSAKAPDPNADMGHHHFSYSIFVSDKGILDTIKTAEELNNPLLYTGKEFLPLVVPSDGVVLESMKISEDEKALVFRVREPLGVYREASFSFASSLDTSTLVETNMIEEEKEAVSTSFHPFEVKTYRIERK